MQPSGVFVGPAILICFIHYGHVCNSVANLEALLQLCNGMDLGDVSICLHRFMDKQRNSKLCAPRGRIYALTGGKTNYKQVQLMGGS